MYLLSASFSNSASHYVSVNSTNTLVATAGSDGNIHIRSMSQFQGLVPGLDDQPAPEMNLDNDPGSHVITIDSDSDGNNNKENNPDHPLLKKRTEESLIATDKAPTVASRQLQTSPSIDKSKLEQAQTPINIVGIRSRSKITCLKFANLPSDSNLLVAVYKNGEVYIVTNPDNKETCQTKFIFKHVNGLLLDFSWSADDQLLAFTSMNNEIMIYDVFYQKTLITLHLHQLNHGDESDSSVPVKGISFDKNSNKYLLTQGDDKFLNVLEYHLENDPDEGRIFKYEIRERIGHLITSSKLNKAAVRKVSWSRDDRVFSCPKTAKGKIAMISLLNNPDPLHQQNWNDWCMFTGHGFKCTMTQFSPCIYRNPKNSKTDDFSPTTGRYYYVLASASYDSTIAIWNTAASAPLIIANEVSANGIQDICWSNDGKLLFITTSAGELLLGVFGNNELGEVVPLDDKDCGVLDLDTITKQFKESQISTRDEYLRNQERKMLESLNQRAERGGKKKDTKAKKEETKETKDIKEKKDPKERKDKKEKKEPKEKKPKKERSDSKSSPSDSKSDSKSDSNNFEIIEYTPTGNSNKKLDDKKIIINLDGPSDSPSPSTTSTPPPEKKKRKYTKKSDFWKTVNNSSHFKGSQDKDNNGNPKDKEVLIAPKPLVPASVVASPSKETPPAPVISITPKETEKIIAPAAPKEVKNGKKRIQPTAVTNGNTKSTPQVTEQPQPAPPVPQKKRPLVASEFDGPSCKVPKDLSNKVAKKFKKDSTGGEGGDQPTEPAQKKKRELENVEYIGNVVLNPQVSFSNIRISIPTVKQALQRPLPEDDSIMLEIQNGNGHESQPTRIVLRKKISDEHKKQLFVDFIPNRVHLATGAGSYWALSTINGQVITYTDSGRRVLPPIILGSPLSFLEIKSQYLMAVTSIGELYTWNLQTHKAVFKPTSLYPLLQPIYRSSQFEVSNSQANGSSVDQNGLLFVNGELLTRSENLTMCSITSNGIPIVTLSNGNGYLYNSGMSSWSLISDSWWAFGSQYWDSTGSIAHSTNSLLGYLEANTNEEILRKGKGRFFSKISKVMLMREGYENLETVISLNHLENKITIYKYLEDGKNFKSCLIIYVQRLGELNLKSRLVEVFQELFLDMDGKVCGFTKKDLLRDLILSCSKYREVQRVLLQYGDSIGIIEDDFI